MEEVKANVLNDVLNKSQGTLQEKKVEEVQPTNQTDISNFETKEENKPSNMPLFVDDIKEEKEVSVKYYLSTQYIKTLIAHKERHSAKGNGFGYDSLFVPDGYDKTFAQLPAEVKNSISHRARALAELAKIIK